MLKTLSLLVFMLVTSAFAATERYPDPSVPSIEELGLTNESRHGRILGTMEGEVFHPQIWLSEIGLTYRIISYDLKSDHIEVCDPLSETKRYELDVAAVNKAKQIVLPQSRFVIPEPEHSLDDDDEDMCQEESAQPRTKTSRFHGVYWHRRCSKWAVAFSHATKRYYGGYHQNEEDAARAYDRIVQTVPGKTFKLNFPPTE